MLYVNSIVPSENYKIMNLNSIFDRILTVTEKNTCNGVIEYSCYDCCLLNALSQSQLTDSGLQRSNIIFLVIFTSLVERKVLTSHIQNDAILDAATNKNAL